MAKNQNIVKVKALVYLRYDEKSYSIGDELKVRDEDSQEMIDRGYIELLGKVSEELEGETKEGEG